MTRNEHNITSTLERGILRTLSFGICSNYLTITTGTSTGTTTGTTTETPCGVE